MVEGKKLSSVPSPPKDINDVRMVLAVKTRLGCFVGEEELDEAGNVIGLKNAVEMVAAVDNNTNKPVAMGVLIGDMTEFPDEYALFEVSSKSAYRTEYTRITSGLIINK